MTSQIALLNPDGVAVASDSTVSIGDRTFSATKIYQLAGRQPVGFMTCGRASYRGISFSNIFGQFRSYFGQKYPQNAELPHLIDYVGEFQKFLLAFPNNSPTPQANEIDRVNAHTPSTSKNISEQEKQDFIHELRELASQLFPSLMGLKAWYSFISSKDTLDPNRWRKLADKDGDWASLISLDGNSVVDVLESNLRNEICTWHSKIKETWPDDWPQIKKQISRKYSSLINEYVSEFIARYSLPKTVITAPLREIFYHHLAFVKKPYYPTGIAIFGFGEIENNPSLVQLEVGLWRSGEDCTAVATDYETGDPIHYTVTTNWKQMGVKDNIQYVPSCLQTFAMSTEMDAILKGYHSTFQRNFTNSASENIFPEFFYHVLKNTKGVGNELMTRIFEESQSEQAQKYLKKTVLKDKFFKGANRMSDFHNVIRLLPMDELANFAETMVDIESKITHLSKGVRKVGGQTDVATITKEDGFLWVKSKTRVDYSLNPRQAVQRDSASLK